MEIWTEILDNGGSLDAIYFDFMKAFDTVSHKRLIGKLESYGISEDVIEWVKSFLTDRRSSQRVRVNDCCSDFQDSVLGPMLFVIYINDLPDKLESDCYMFADDIYYRVMLRNTTLEHVEKEKDIGVNIDSKLTFEYHMNEKINKANSIMGIIRRTFTCLDKETFLLLYKALVRPHLEYDNTFWSPYKIKDITAIENVQRRTTKLVPSLTNLEHEDRIRKLKLPTLKYRRL